MALTKTDIIDKIAKDNNLSPTEAKDTVEELLEILKTTLASGEDVMITGFGRFCVNEKKPRRGRNPATGEDIILKKRRVITFKCSGKLRDKIN